LLNDVASPAIRAFFNASTQTAASWGGKSRLAQAIAVSQKAFLIFEDVRAAFGKERLPNPRRGTIPSRSLELPMSKNVSDL
jgi:hypothetical protein